MGDEEIGIREVRKLERLLKIRMNRRITIKNLALPLILFAATGAILSGCSRDPNIRKQKYLASAKRYMTKGKYPEASIELGNALRIDAKFAEARYQLAECDAHMGLLAQAYVELQRTVILQPDNLQARLELGELMLAARRFSAAAEQADRILAKDPNNVNAHILKSASNAGLKHLDAAISEMNAAVQLDPSQASSYANLAALQTAGSPDSPSAEANLKKAIELDTKAVSPRINLAALYEHARRFPEAEAVLKEALQFAPKDSSLYAALVHHYQLLGDRAAAENAAKDAKASLSPDPDGAQFLARYYLSVGEGQSAITEYRRLAEQYPKEREIQHAYLQISMSLGQTEDAWKEIGFILKKSPKDEKALTAKGILLISQSKPAEAREVLQEVVKADPQSVVAHFYLGNAFDMLGDTGQAENHWTEAARIAPTYLPAQNALAKVALSNGDVSLLKSIAKIVTERAPNVPDGYRIQAHADALQNNAKNAELELQKAISLAPGSTDTYIDLGRLYMQEKRNGEAEKVLNQVLVAEPQSAEALTALVQLFVNNKQLDKATSRVQETIAKSPNFTEAHLLLAELAGSQNNLELAEGELTKALQLERSPRIYSMLAGAQMQRGEFPKVHATLESAIQNNPKDAEAYWMLGTLYDQENDTLNAENNYRKTLGLRPDFGLAANNLAFLLVQNAGNVDEAISFAEIARHQLPGNAAVADTLGWAYYEKGLSGLAIEMLQDAVKTGPENASYHYHLGMAYAKNGSRLRARDEFQKAMQLESDEARKDEIRKGIADLG